MPSQEMSWMPHLAHPVRLPVSRLILERFRHDSQHERAFSGRMGDVLLETGSRPNVLSVVLAGGEGKRMMPLTLDRAKPAVPFGGHYRLIDFALSNLANGGYRKLVVLTQYKSHSLDVHISKTWRLSTMLGNYVTSVPAQMRRGQHWFQGSADALFQNLNLVDDEQPDYIFVFGADHIYRMDPRQMLDQHIESGAACTVAALRGERSEAHQFGIIDQGEGTSIKAFLEKPADPPGLLDDPTKSFVSMGNYVFTTDALRDALQADADNETSKHDLGGDLIPYFVDRGEAHVYDYSTNLVPGDGTMQRGYWRDVGTLDAYFDANMDLVKPLPPFSLYNSKWPIWTLGRSLPAAKFVIDGSQHPAVSNSMVSNGSILSGCTVHEAVVSPGCRISRGANVNGAVLFDDVSIGEGAVVKRAIIDKNVRVPAGTRIGVDREEDLARFPVTDSGIVAITKNYSFD